MGCEIKDILLIDNSCQGLVYISVIVGIIDSIDLFPCLKKKEERKNMGGNDACIPFQTLPYQKTDLIVFRPAFSASYF